MSAARFNPSRVTGMGPWAYDCARKMSETLSFNGLDLKFDPKTKLFIIPNSSDIERYSIEQILKKKNYYGMKPEVMNKVDQLGNKVIKLIDTRGAFYFNPEDLTPKAEHLKTKIEYLFSLAHLNRQEISGIIETIDMMVIPTDSEKVEEFVSYMSVIPHTYYRTDPVVKQLANCIIYKCIEAAKATRGDAGLRKWSTFRLVLDMFFLKGDVDKAIEVAKLAIESALARPDNIFTRETKAAEFNGIARVLRDTSEELAFENNIEMAFKVADLIPILSERFAALRHVLDKAKQLSTIFADIIINLEQRVSELEQFEDSQKVLGMID